LNPCTLPYCFTETAPRNRAVLFFYKVLDRAFFGKNRVMILGSRKIQREPREVRGGVPLACRGFFRQALRRFSPF